MRAFESDDVHELNAWLKARGLGPVTAASLPALGLIAPGVAAGFLRRCEGQVGIFDSFATNPAACPVMRHKALDEIYKRLIAQAYELGIDKLIGFSVDAGTVERSKRHGFVLSDYPVLTRG